jgi:hypothetical protein
MHLLGTGTTVTPHYIIIIILVLQPNAAVINLRHTWHSDKALGLSSGDAQFESRTGHH